jgi:acetyl-CoA C-acetyltransferase
MGSCCEKFISEMGITRQAQDEFAVQSYTRARAAQEGGLFDNEIVEVIQQGKKGEIKFKLDEECQKFMPDKFPGLKPVFAKNGTITAANSSKLNDGACVFVLMSEKAAKARGLKPIARIVSYEDASVAPIDFGLAPSLAVNKLLKRTGLKLSDINYFEFNEAFAAVGLANLKLLDLDPAHVNVNGGAVALGHPLGMSGARIIQSVLSVLKQKNGTLGLASICNGGGGASAIVVERMN